MGEAPTGARSNPPFTRGRLLPGAQAGRGEVTLHHWLSAAINQLCAVPWSQVCRTFQSRAGLASPKLHARCRGRITPFEQRFLSISDIIDTTRPGRRLDQSADHSGIDHAAWASLCNRCACECAFARVRARGRACERERERESEVMVWYFT